MFAAEEMLPCFQAAGCHNYVHYSQLDVHHMKGLNQVLIKKTARWCLCSPWTDMFIESTYMRLGPAGALGLATDWNQMVTWALSSATCGELAYDVTQTNNMNNGQRGVIHIHQKEASQDRIQNDDDRCIIRSTLIIDPLSDASQPDGALMNIITGDATPPPPDVNVDDQ